MKPEAPQESQEPQEPDRMSSGDWVAGAKRRYGPEILRFIRQKVRNEQDAQDLDQEVYIRLLDTENLEKINEPLAYIRTVIKSVIFSASRRKKRVSFDSDVADRHMGALMTSACAAEECCKEDELDWVFSKFSKNYQNVVLGSARGLSDEEIACALNLTPQTVAQYRLRAIARLFEACAPGLGRANGKVGGGKPQ